jgi:hypothetical protein
MFFQPIRMPGWTGLLGAITLSALTVHATAAHSYPAGSAVSTAANPVVSIGGYIDGSSSVVLFDAPGDQMLIITDVTLSLANPSSTCMGAMGVSLATGGTTIAAYGVGYPREGVSNTKAQPLIVQSFRSGLPIAPGQTLSITTNQLWQGYCSDNKLRVYYTLSGYHAQP